MNLAQVVTRSQVLPWAFMVVKTVQSIPSWVLGWDSPGWEVVSVREMGRKRLDTKT